MALDKIVDLGDWAEDKFSSLCSRAGITRNKSNQDRTGWDYLIEFPSTVMPDIPADLSPTEISARVQVKSKRSGKASVTIKLSNALRFAKDPLPCFVVLFLASDGSEPVRIFARHFWEQEISQTLKRAREAYADRRDDLHNLSMSLSFGTQDEHRSDLMAWMETSIAAHRERYAEFKAALVRTVGFEDGFIHGNIQFKHADLEALVDHQIGLAPAAPAINITIKGRRFGIDGISLFEGVPDFVCMQSHPLSCRVRVRGAVGEDVWVDGQLFVPGLPCLPDELRKVRVVAEFIEIVIVGTCVGDVTFHLDRSTHYSLPTLRALANVLTAAEKGPLQIQISKDDKVLLFTVNMSGGESGGELEQVSNVIACLEKASAGLLPAELTLSRAEIDKAWNMIVVFNGMATGTDMKSNFTLASELPAEAGPAKSIFFYDFVDIGGWTFMAVVRRSILKFEIDGLKGVFECGNPRVVEAIVRRGTGGDHIAELQELYSRARKVEGEGVLDFCGGNYRAVISAANKAEPTT